jgi:hypothetical protein
MKPYTIRGRSYLVTQATGAVVRPSRLAAGMSATSYRSGHSLQGDALSLAVRGSIQTPALRFCIASQKRPPCPCCGLVGTGLVLNDSGRRKLAALRRGRA